MKRLVINNRQSISEPQEVKLTESDIESGQDSTILVRGRIRGSKLQGAFQKRKGILLEQSDHTITFLPTGKETPTDVSQRDVGYNIENQPRCSKEVDRRLMASRGELHNACEEQTPPTNQDDSTESKLEMMV